MTDFKKLSTPLDIRNIDFRVGSAINTATKKWVTILAYKDARVDMNYLDLYVGSENWQIKFREEKGCVVASIGIRADGGDWVWKEGNGIQSDFEAEKGAYSDAQKRAGFQWGIGRSLYNFPKIFVEVFDDECTTSANKITMKSSFRPNDWDWTVGYTEDGEVSLLIAKNNGKVRFTYNKK